MTSPVSDYPDLTRQTMEAIGVPVARLRYFAGLDAWHPLGTKPEECRQRTAELLGILLDTLRRERHEGLLLWDVGGGGVCDRRPLTAISAACV